MRQFQVNSPSEDIVHPTCAKCGAPMWLTRIEPDGPGSEKRTFECQACQNEAIESSDLDSSVVGYAIQRPSAIEMLGRLMKAWFCPLSDIGNILSSVLL